MNARTAVLATMIAVTFATIGYAQFDRFRKGRERSRGIGDYNASEFPQPDLPQTYTPQRPGESPIRLSRHCRVCGSELPDDMGPGDDCAYCGSSYREALLPPIENGHSASGGYSGQNPNQVPTERHTEYSPWASTPGHNLIRLGVGAVIAAILAAVIWFIRLVRQEQLQREYQKAVRTHEHSVSKVLRNEGDAISETEESSSSVPPSFHEWLLGRGLTELADEIAKARATRPRCSSCRYASSGGMLVCPHAFACGALRHPRASLSYAMLRGLKWFGLGVVIVAVIVVVSTIVPGPSRPNARSPWEAMIVSAPWILALLGAVCGLVVTWNCWNALVIRRQVREVAQAAQQLGLDYLNYRKMPLGSDSLAFPLIHPGEIREVHLAMCGWLNDQPLIAAYYEYEMAERDGPGSEMERRTAVVRGWMGKEVQLSFAQFVIMFPQPLASVPDFQMTPNKDIDFYLRRVAYPVPEVVHDPQLTEKYCVTSLDPAAGTLFDEPFRRFLLANDGWNVQCLLGRLMLWHGKYDVLEAKISPGKRELVVADIETALRWREQLLRRQQSMAEEAC
jgi:hypothetical protein